MVMDIHGTQILVRLSTIHDNPDDASSRLVLSAHITTATEGSTLYTAIIPQDGTLDRVNIVAVVTGTLDIEFYIVNSDGDKENKQTVTIKNGANDWIDSYDVMTGDVISIKAKSLHNPSGGTFALTSLDVSAVLEV